MVDLAAQVEPLRAAIDEAIARVVSSQRFIGGPEVEAFEAAMAGLCGSAFAVACASGSDALLLALQAAGVGPGDAVLCPSFSFFATAGSVARLGARPVFVDVDPETLVVGPEQAEAGRRVAPDARAIVPVDLFGRVAPIGALLAWAEPHGIAVVEDAAQALAGRDVDGVPAGGRAHATAISFFPSKNLGAFGDGGLVATGSETLAERVRSLRDHGLGPDGRHHLVGTNSRLDALQAAVLRVKVEHLDAWTKRRHDHADAYDRRFARAGAHVGGPADASRPLTTPPPVAAPGRHVHNQYVIRVEAKRRESLRARLGDHGIETRIYYPRGIHEEPCFAGADAASLPATRSAAAQCLALPIRPELTPAERDEIADRVIEGLGL
jgi:dTDP-4-amino-4,6-dideoxygalactose transaminase